MEREKKQLHEFCKITYCNKSEYIGDYLCIPTQDLRYICDTMDNFLKVKFAVHTSDFIYHLKIEEKKIFIPGKSQYNTILSIYFNMLNVWNFTLTDCQIIGKDMIKNDKN